MTLGGRLALELRVKSGSDFCNSGTCIISFKPPNKFLSSVLIAGEDQDSRRLNNLFKVIQLESDQFGTWGSVCVTPQSVLPVPLGCYCQLLVGSMKFEFGK